MPTKLSVSRGVFQLNGQPSHLLSGEVHYFRVPPEQWPASLARVRSLGLSAISTYSPWVWHEPQPGHFDFTGETHPGRNLVGFLEACRQNQLLVLARPGPLIYAEFQGLGVPLWLGQRHPESVAVRRDHSLDRGDFYFNHSLLHPVYLSHVRRWYEALVPVLQPYFHDPVVSWQLDNETGLLCENRIGEVDFNADTVARFRAYLKERYGSIEELNTAWGRRYASFDRVEPPYPPLRQAQLNDWQVFLEAVIDEYLGWLRRVSQELGVPVPLAHNEQGLHHAPVHGDAGGPFFEMIGYDLYPKASPGPHTLDFPFATSFYPSLFAAYAGDRRPLWASELGMGWMDPRARVSEEAVVQNIFGSLARGARGLNLFPVHDGSEPETKARYAFRTALDARGHFTPRARTVESVSRFLEEHGPRLLASRVVHDPVAFGLYYPNFRFAAEDYLRQTLYLDPHRFLAFLGQGGVHALLLCAGFNPSIVDVGLAAEREDFEALAPLRVLVLTSKGILDEKTYRLLERWVAAGGHLVTAPVPPTRNLRGFPARYTPLFPVAPTRVQPVDRVLSYVTMGAGLLRYWLFQRTRLREEHLSSGHVIEMYEPVLHLLSTPARGVPHAHPWGEPIPGDYLSASFDLRTAPRERKVEPGPLRRVRRSGTLVSSYVARHGTGTSTVLGTLPGGRYVTPRYYAVPGGQRAALREFARGLLAERGVVPAFQTDLEVELVPHHTEGGGGYLFVVNRLGRQRGRIRLRRAAEWGYAGHVRVAYTLLGSGGVMIDREVIEVDIFPQDVLVLYFPAR